jgi:hypothetical protein
MAAESLPISAAWGLCREIQDGSMRVRNASMVVLAMGLGCAVAFAADDLPPGKMQAKVKTACTQCHTVANITKKPRTRAEWSKVIDKMTTYGAEVDDKDRDAILDYLSTNFGPGKASAAKATKTPKTPKND